MTSDERQIIREFIKIGIPFIKKYLHSPLPATSGSSDDFPIYRYSEALLLLAQVLNEQGRPGEALTPLNRVRTRAGLDRWEDHLRSGKALDVVNAFGVKIRQQLSYLPLDSHVVTDHNLLFPIPQDNLDLNPKLIQNR